MKVIRVLVYEGDEEWLKTVLHHSAVVATPEKPFHARGGCVVRELFRGSPEELRQAYEDSQIFEKIE